MRFKKSGCTLKRIALSDEQWLKVIETTSQNHLIKVDDLAAYDRGYSNRLDVYYTAEILICTRWRLVYCGILNEDLDIDHWYQLICVRSYEQEINFANISNPAASCRRIKKILHNHYDDNEILKIYEQHEKNDSHIIHSAIQAERFKIKKFENCYYYDANGAYASQLIEMFPKCTEDFKYKFEHRHDNNNEGKNDFNFFVGCLTQNEKKIANGARIRETHPKTRHYIVDNVSKMLVKLKNELNPDEVIYANTDGIVVQNPRNILPNESDIGTFKIEYQGDVLTYRGDNYTIMQMGDEIKGDLPLSLRHLVDLRIGKVISYTRVLRNGIYFYENIKEINLND